MNRSIDIQFGAQAEIEIISDLRIIFNDETITKTPKIYDSFDFIGENKYIELKTRRCSSNTYTTSIIGMNKFNNIDITNYDYYLVFKFTNNIMYCRYEPNDFKEFEKKEITRRDRGCIERGLYYCVPISYLKEFKSTRFT